MKHENNPTINVVREAESASALLNPIRLQMLEHLKEPNSASGLSRILKIPRQKVNYHLRELEKRGLVKFVEEVRKGNCMERIVKATARAYLINLNAVGELPVNPEEVKDRFSSAYLIGTASKIINDTTTLRERANQAKKKLSTLTLQTEINFDSPNELHEFAEELSKTIAHLATKYNKKNKSGRTFNFNICGYPKITK